MNKIPSIIVYSDCAHSACSFWRSHGVLSILARQGYINFIEGTWNDTWTKLQFADIAFFQRPMSRICEKQILMAKDIGLKIIIDLDDYNYISPSHPVYKVWCETYDDKIFQKIMLCADVVTVSTKELQKYYLTYNNNVVIVPNALNDDWLPFNNYSNNKIVIIRAGEHHLSDIWYYKDEIIEVMQRYKTWKLQCLGSPVQFFFGKIDNYEFKGEFDVHDYFAFILRTNPSIFIVPLEDNELNRCKSNISWQEATLSGAVSLTPNYWGLYNKSMLYEDRESFKYQFNKLIENEELRHKLYQNSLKEVKDKYVLSKVNEQRMEIINNLIQ